MPNLDEQMIDLYGPLPQFSDFKRGEHITYRQGSNTYTGTIVWACGPGDVVGRHVPTHYIVEPDHRQGMPDTVYQADIVI